MAFRSKFFKYSYIGIKCAAAGIPLAYLSVKLTKLYLREILKEDIPSTACKIGVVTCSPVTSAIIAGAHFTPTQMHKFTKVSRAAVKAAKLVSTGSVAGMDVCLSTLEEAFFGESLPIIIDFI